MAIYVDGSKLQIKAKSMSIVTIYSKLNFKENIPFSMNYFYFYIYLISLNSTYNRRKSKPGAKSAVTNWNHISLKHLFHKKILLSHIYLITRVTSHMDWIFLLSWVPLSLEQNINLLLCWLATYLSYYQNYLRH